MSHQSLLKIVEKDGYEVKYKNENVMVRIGEGGTIHVTEVEAYKEEACKYLDALTRAEFSNIENNKGDVHLLVAPAGSGKTTCNINLARNFIHKFPDKKVLLLAFNRCAVEDGKERTKDDGNIVWKTIDSIVWNLFKDEFENKDAVDLDDPFSISKMANAVLDYPVYPEEVDEYQYALNSACNSGNPSGLVGDARLLYDAGLRGEWWSFSMLRIRACTNPMWKSMFRNYELICVDESQDLNVVMLRLLFSLHSTKTMIYTGDPSQKLYDFMGCVDVTTQLKKGEFKLWKLYITFRYGKSLCEWVNDRNLPRYATFPADGLDDTSIEHTADDDIVQGKHVCIVSTWKDALHLADSMILKGRNAFIDEDKQSELREAANNKGYTKHNRSLFKKTSKEFVLDVINRMTKDCENVIFITTIHGYKGLEASVVRVMRSVYERRNNMSILEYEKRLYVAVTRAKSKLVLPSSDRKRKSCKI